MKDCIGQEIKVGDIVVPTNSSSIYGKVQVVTRFGSGNKIQLNGSSYAKAKYLVRITEQFKLAKGQEEFDKVIAEYKDEFNQEAVAKKTAPVRYLVYKIETYPTAFTQAKKRFYFCIAVQGTMQERGTTLSKWRSVFQKLTGAEYYSAQTLLPKRMTFAYYNLGDDFSLKAIKEMQLEAYIDSQIICPDLIKALDERAKS